MALAWPRIVPRAIGAVSGMLSGWAGPFRHRGDGHGLEGVRGAEELTIAVSWRHAGDGSWSEGTGQADELASAGPRPCAGLRWRSEGTGWAEELAHAGSSLHQASDGQGRCSPAKGFAS